MDSKNQHKDFWLLTAVSTNCERKWKKAKDKRTEEAKKIKADAMLADLQSTKASAPLSANETLVASTSSSVPLPPNEDVHPPAVDDLEF